LDLKALGAGWARRIAQWLGALRVVTLLPLRRQLAVLGSVLAALLAAALWLAWSEYRETHFGEGHLVAAGEMRTLSQRLAKSALRSLRGDPEAFAQVQASRDGFASALSRLSKDGRSPAAVRSLAAEWERTERNATTLLRDQRLLTALAAAAAGMERANPLLLERAERVQNLKLQRGAPAAEVAAASRLVMLTQRMARGAQQLLAADAVDPEVEFVLGKDVNEFRGTLAQLREGAREAGLAAALGELAESFGLYQDAVVAVLGTRARLAGAKDAASAIHADSERLLEAVDRVVAAYRAAPAPRAYEFGLAATALALLGALLLLALFYVHDERRQREGIARRHVVMRRTHERDLEAVELLRRELEGLATGDLTARVTVNSEITYPVAATLNDALEALRQLVARVAAAAERVGGAAGGAQAAADGLFQAAQRQSERIRGASASALGMARMVNELSTRANQSAELSRAARAAALQGHQAVQAALSVMRDLGARIRVGAAQIDRLRGASPELGRTAGALNQIAAQAEALSDSASGQTLGDLGELLRKLAEKIEEVSKATQSQAGAASSVAGGVREVLSGAEQAADAATRAAGSVEELAELLRGLREALQKLRT
jgi:twitching motility protein PilJ